MMRPPFWRSTRLLLLVMVTLSVLAVVAMGAVADRGVWRISREEDRLIEAGVTVMRDAYRLKIAAERQVVGTRGFALTGMPPLLEPFTQGSQEFQAGIRSLESRLRSSEEQRLLAEVRRLEQDYRDNALRIIAMRQDGAPPERLIPMISRGEALKDRMILALDQLIASQEAKVREFHAAINRSETRIRWALWAIAGIFSLLTLATAGQVVRRAMVPLKDLEQASREVGSGNLEVQAPLRREDEFGQVAAAFNLMARRLKENFETLHKQATLLENAYDAMLARDLRENRITYWNRGAEHQYGYSKAEAMGRDASFLESRPSQPLDEITRALETSGRWEGEVTHTHRDGREVITESRWTLLRDPQGQASILLENNHDVTARRRAEREVEKLRRRERWEFEQFVRAVEDYAVFMLDSQGRVLTWNEGAMHITGYAADEIIGQPYARFFPPDEVAAGTPDARLQSARERGNARVEGWRVRKNGERFWAEASLTALRDAQGEATGFITITRDLSARQELQRRQQEIETLRQVNQMKEQFLTILSHELRTPINAIMGFGSLLAEEVPGPLNAEQHRFLRKILGGAESLLYLVNDLLDMSRMAAGKFKLDRAPMRLEDTLANVLETLEPLAGAKQQTLIADVPPELPGIVADAQRVGQVVMNLVGNAIKYTPAGGTIQAAIRREGNWLRCTIRDNGPGIALRDQAELFHAFFRVPASTAIAQGTGLGLPISKALVEAHGGEIGVDSTPGQGASFWFTLPIEPAG